VAAEAGLDGLEFCLLLHRDQNDGHGGIMLEIFVVLHNKAGLLRISAGVQ
jgi:hypothetical protein